MRQKRESTAKRAMEAMRDPLWIQSRLKQYEPRVFYFDFIECVRKLCIVGLSVFFEEGSSQNLAFGVLVTATFLCVTVRLHPYILATDDVLAISTQAALLLTLCLAIMLKSARDLAAYRPETLAEFEGFQSRVGHALIGIAAAPIALAILFVMIDLGAASPLARCLQRGARRPSGAKGGVTSVEVTATAAEEEKKAARASLPSPLSSLNEEDEEGGGHDEKAGGGGATEDEEAAGEISYTERRCSGSI